MPDAMLDVEKSKANNTALPVACPCSGEGARHVTSSLQRGTCPEASRVERRDLGPGGASVLQANTHTGSLTFGGILGEPLDAPGPQGSALTPQNPLRAL